MASKLLRLAHDGDFPGVIDAYVIREPGGNPIGLSHNTQYSGSNVKILNTTDVKFNVNSLAVAESNSARIQAIIDAMPDSGGAIGIPHDIALTNITFPTRVTQGYPPLPNPGGGTAAQVINFEIFGTRPGVNIYGMSTDPLFTIESGFCGSIHTVANMCTARLRDINIACRGTGVYARACGKQFTADNVNILSEIGPAWHFKDCYGMELGRVGATNGFNAIGFLFDYCIQLSFGMLWSRGNRIGVKIANTTNLYENSTGRSGNFFGHWDVEGNYDWQIEAEGWQKSVIGLYMEGAKKMSLTRCENLEFSGDGFRVDYADDSSLLLNPKIFEVQRNRVEPGIHYTNYGGLPNPLVSTGTYSWECAFPTDMVNNGNWIDCARGLLDNPGFDGDGKAIEIRWRAKGTGPGARIGRLTYSGSPGWSIDIVPSTDWIEYVSEPFIQDGAYSRLLCYGEIGAFMEFELMHVAYITRKENYTV